MTEGNGKDIDSADDARPLPSGPSSDTTDVCPVGGVVAAEPLPVMPASATGANRVPQLDVMLSEPDIAPYLTRGRKDEHPFRLRRIALGLTVTLAALFLAYALPSWKMFARYRPPVPAETPKPRAYQGEIPLLFRETVKEINAAIDGGNQWQAVFNKLSAFVDAIDSGTTSPATEIEIWARTELLVALASREVPPSAYEEALPEGIYHGLETMENAPPVSFRAEAAYVRIRNAASWGKNTAAAESPVIEHLERLRAAHADLLDNTPELLVIEAERHIAAIPREYAPGNRFLDYHWRRAAHAISRLYALRGGSDAQTRTLDRKRWQGVFKYFDLTLLTWDVGNIGWRKSIVLDGREYTRGEIESVLKGL